MAKKKSTMTLWLEIMRPQFNGSVYRAPRRRRPEEIFALDLELEGIAGCELPVEQFQVDLDLVGDELFNLEGIVAYAVPFPQHHGLPFSGLGRCRYLEIVDIQSVFTHCVILGNDFLARGIINTERDRKLMRQHSLFASGHRHQVHRITRPVHATVRVDEGPDTAFLG